MGNQLVMTQMTQDEVQNIMLKWAEEEGWNPGLDDAASFYVQNPNGFFAGRLNGEVVGCYSAVIYDQTFAFFGLYIVKPAFRHRGLGMQMTQHCLDYLAGLNIGLDGVVEMAKKYERIGFRPSHLNIRYEGTSTLDKREDPDIVEVGDELLAQIVQYDRSYFPASRTRFLHHWLKRSSNKMSFVCVDQGAIKGYGTIRKCCKGYKLGPLFAETPQIAEKIFEHLIVQTKGEVFYLDIPEPNLAALELVKKYQMKECFKTLRMYTKGNPQMNIDHIFGVTTLECG